jgi:hypothetical protein
VADQTWLELEDELLLDDVDYRVARVLLARTDRLTFQRLTVVPQLGGERRVLLQTEDAVMHAHEIDPQALSGEEVALQQRAFKLRWDGAVRTERSAAGSGAKFGAGRCAWYAAEDGAVAVLIVERYERDAFIGEPLDPSRIDLRFTPGLREGQR